APRRARATLGEPTNMKPRWVLLILAALIAGGVAWRVRKQSPASGGAPAGSASATPDRVIPVAEAPAQTRDVPIWLEGLGNATPLYTVTVKTQVDGRLDRVLFREGDLVKAGQVIAQVDPRPFQIALTNAQAALARDAATLRNAKLNLERYKSLRA